MLDRAGRIVVRPDPEGTFTLEFQEMPNLLQDLRDITFVHTGRLVVQSFQCEVGKAHQFGFRGNTQEPRRTASVHRGGERRMTLLRSGLKYGLFGDSNVNLTKAVPTG